MWCAPLNVARPVVQVNEGRASAASASQSPMVVLKPRHQIGAVVVPVAANVRPVVVFAYVPTLTLSRSPAASFVTPSASVQAPLAPELVSVVPLPPPAASART